MGADAVVNLAGTLGKSRSHVANTLRLLKLSPHVRGLIERGQISAGHGRALLAVEDADAVADRIVERGLTVQQTLTYFAAQGIAVLLLELPTSGFADAFGRKAVNQAPVPAQQPDPDPGGPPPQPGYGAPAGGETPWEDIDNKDACSPDAMAPPAKYNTDLCMLPYEG